MQVSNVIKNMSAISLTNVQFSYSKQQDTPVLSIPAWSLEKGALAFVHGASGSGKSTLLSILSGLLAPIEGEVQVLGHTLTRMHSLQRDRFRANHIGYVFQQFNLIPYLNAIDNIRLAHQFSNRRRLAVIVQEIKAVLSTLNIAESDWRKPTGQLSIGQQQRVAIARALINKPELLIADEPTSSLDQANRDSFMELLMQTVENHDMTLLFVSHDLALAQYFKRVESISDFNLARGA